MAVAAFQLEDVTKRYGRHEAVRGLTMSAERGHICGFLGPNGAGKTTTIRMLLGLVAPTRGRITVLGWTNVRRARDRVGFLPEERGLYRRMTPMDAVVFFAGLKGMPAAEARRKGREMLEAQGLGEYLHKPIKTLSKGMAQKVQLVTAVAHDPDLLILDEPFSGLDPVNQQTLEQMIRGLAKRGATVMFSTHVMQHAERLCDRVVLLARGEKVFDGKVSEAKAAAPRILLLEGRVTADEAASLPGVTAVEPTAPAEAGGPPRLSALLAPGASVQDALRAVFAAGYDVDRFEMKEPTLHDAFIVLTGQSRDLPAEEAA
jgi:ABC-2 type transport system ATP-binding protein